MRNAKGVLECGLVPNSLPLLFRIPAIQATRKMSMSTKHMQWNLNMTKSQLLGIINDFLRPTNNKIY